MSSYHIFSAKAYKPLYRGSKQSVISTCFYEIFRRNGCKNGYNGDKREKNGQNPALLRVVAQDI